MFEHVPLIQSQSREMLVSLQSLQVDVCRMRLNIHLITPSLKFPQKSETVKII